MANTSLYTLVWRRRARITSSFRILASFELFSARSSSSSRVRTLHSFQKLHVSLALDRGKRTPLPQRRAPTLAPGAPAFRRLAWPAPYRRRGAPPLASHFPLRAGAVSTGFPMRRRTSRSSCASPFCIRFQRATLSSEALFGFMYSSSRASCFSRSIRVSCSLRTSERLRDMASSRDRVHGRHRGWSTTSSPLPGADDSASNSSARLSSGGAGA